MKSYYLITLLDGTQEILRDTSLGGGQFPMNESNPHYQEYLAWVAEGNTAEEWTGE